MEDRGITICFVYFRTLTLQHLEAAWFSLSQQDLTDVTGIRFLDNNTDDDPRDIGSLLLRYRFWPKGTLGIEFNKHGDSTRTQSWSVNHVADWAPGPWIFFTRADYILDKDALRKFRAERDALLAANEDEACFITSYAYHMAYDERGDQRIEGFRDIEKHDWRTRGAQVLLTEVNGWKVESSHLDAGVWLTRRDLIAEVGGLNERLSAWGYQQTVFQRALREAGVEIVQIPEFLFFHQHHAAPRSYDIAKTELQTTGLSIEDLRAFRPDVATHAGNVCDELDKK